MLSAYTASLLDKLSKYAHKSSINEKEREKEREGGREEGRKTALEITREYIESNDNYL